MLRRGLMALCGAGVVGTAVELAMLRHWTSWLQFVPWLALLPLGSALGFLAARPSRASVTLARGVALLVMVVAGFGIVEHVKANYDAGPLDRRYSARWETMSEPSRWWTAASGGVGPSPALAPGILGQAAVCLALATMHHPSTARSRDVRCAVPAFESRSYGGMSARPRR
jgi:hypothetical protein